jgi:ribonuclease R
MPVPYKTNTVFGNSKEGYMSRKSNPSAPLDENSVLAALKGGAKSLRDLAKDLKVPATGRGHFKHQLQGMLARRRLVQVKGGFLALGESQAAQSAGTLLGRVVQKQAEYAFVVPQEPDQKDFYVASADLQDALPDDIVEARVVPGGTGARRQAKVVKVVKRAHEKLVGTFRRERKLGFLRPAGLPFVREFLIPDQDQAVARDGNQVVAQVTSWPEGYVAGRAKIIEVLGSADEPGVDITVIVRKYGLAEAFSEEAQDQARRLANEPGLTEIAGRLDLRKLSIVTIDGEDARDFDDAVSCEAKPGGGWRLGVHIADVSHYLQEHTPLDLEVRERGTSVYLPDRVLHMLPEPLSTGVCSLVPGRDRLTVSAFMDVEPDGQVSHAEFCRSVIHSAGRLTYNWVEKVLTGQSDDNLAQDFKPELLRLQQASLAIRRDREGRGSLDFDLPEAKVILGPDGRVAAIEKRVSLASHRLIEDCMIAANESVARYLARTDTPALYRIHAQPSGEKFEELLEFLKAYGYRLEAGSPRSASLAFQHLLASWQGKPEAQLLNMVLLRSLKLAVYSPHNIGHFGLASSCYTHFTSPIRRYPDLVVHRALTARLAGPLSPQTRAAWTERLPGLGEQLSTAERRAEKAEREAVRVKQAEFMLARVGEVMAGKITNITNFGFFVELDEVFAEGLVKLGSLGDDYYIFNERERSLAGERHHRRFRLGDPVSVQVWRVNKEEGLVDFVLAAEGRGQNRRPATPWSRPALKKFRRKRR